MQLRLSVLARNRAFSKAMRRVRVRLQPLLDAFEDTQLEHPIHEAILVEITDDSEAEFFKELENGDGFYQVLAGCGQYHSDDQLTEVVFEILQRAVRLCPFAAPDDQKFEALFVKLRSSVLK
jgi:hypothetical protein